jgi:hypothetical protein
MVSAVDNDILMVIIWGYSNGIMMYNGDMNYVWLEPLIIWYNISGDIVMV